MAHFQFKSKFDTVELLFLFFFVLKSFNVFSRKIYFNLGLLLWDRVRKY